MTESTSKQNRYDNVYMEMANSVSSLSFAHRAKVGSVIVKDGNIIAFGFNGTPSGFDNECETLINEPEEECLEYEFKIVTKPEVLHAESNAIAKVARSTQSSENATMYVTLAPCIHCAKQIIQAGITRVVYSENYRKPVGLELLEKAKIECQQLK